MALPDQRDLDVAHVRPGRAGAKQVVERAEEVIAVVVVEKAPRVEAERRGAIGGGDRDDGARGGRSGGGAVRPAAPPTEEGPGLSGPRERRGLEQARGRLGPPA